MRLTRVITPSIGSVFVYLAFILFPATRDTGWLWSLAIVSLDERSGSNVIKVRPASSVGELFVLMCDGKRKDTASNPEATGGRSTALNKPGAANPLNRTLGHRPSANGPEVSA